MSELRLRFIEKVYERKVRVLAGITMDIADGEFLVLVGPSGCGKSTLLRCIAGLEEISDGELFIDDRLVNRVPPKDRDIAMVFQSYALYPHMKVRENMAFSLSVRGMPKDEIARRVSEAAEQLGLTNLLDRFPRQLSGGQRQRVAMGRAIVRNPKVFLFDEPLSNLDAALRVQMRIELKKLHQRLKTTMIYVTHDQIEAMTLADRIAVLNGGLLQQLGTPAELYERPANRFVAGFIGSPSMNFMQGVFRRGERPSVAGPGFEFFLPAEYADIEGIPDEVTVGVRPHQLDPVGKRHGTAQAKVEVLEPIGWDTHMHCTLGDTSVVAQVPSEHIRSIKAGQDVTFNVYESDVHIFHPQSGYAIRPGQPVRAE